MEVREEAVQKYQERKDEEVARRKVKEEGSTGDMSFEEKDEGVVKEKRAGKLTGARCISSCEMFLPHDTRLTAQIETTRQSLASQIFACFSLPSSLFPTHFSSLLLSPRWSVSSLPCLGS